MNQDVAEKTKKSLYWSLSLKIPYEIFKFAMSIATARLLEPGDFGIVSIATFAIYYANSFTNFGFNQALIQRAEISDDHVNSVFVFDIFISALLASLIFLSSGYIAEFFNSPESADVIRVLSIVFIISTLHDLPYVLLKRDLEFKIISIVDTVREVSMAIITFVFAYYGHKYWSIVWGHLIPLFFAMLYLLIKLKRPLRFVYHHKSIRELFDFSIWSFINMQVSFVSNRIDRIVIGKALDVSALGIYEKSKAIIQMPSTSIVDNITSILFSSFSRVQNDVNQINKIFRKGLMIISIINFPLFFGLYSLATWFVLLLLGEKWQGMIVPLQVLCVFGVFASLNGLISVLAISTGHYKQYVIRFTLSTIILVISSVFAIKYSVIGVAFALIISTILLTVLGFNLVKDIYRIKWKDLMVCIWPALISSTVMLISLEVLKKYLLVEMSVLSFVYLILSGCFVYLVMLLIVPSSILLEIRSSLYRDLTKSFNWFLKKYFKL